VTQLFSKKKTRERKRVSKIMSHERNWQISYKLYKITRVIDEKVENLGK
jgi:hypothetical protein